MFIVSRLYACLPPGVVTLLKEYVVCKKGDVLNANNANVLVRRVAMLEFAPCSFLSHLAGLAEQEALEHVAAKPYTRIVAHACAFILQLQKLLGKEQATFMVRITHSYSEKTGTVAMDA